jgi:hypothetical protein
MAKKQTTEKKSQVKSKGGDKGHVMTNPMSGETRYVTEADYRENEKEYMAAGFHRPTGIAPK